MTALDPATLLIASCATTTLVSAQFLISWRQSPGASCLGLWGLAHLVGSAASIGLALRGVIPDWASIGLANTAMITAYGLIWSAVRRFERLPLRPHIAFAGGIVWALLCVIPGFYGSIALRVAFASAVAAGYCFGGAWTFWRGRSEKLASRRFAIGLLAVYGVCYLVRVPAAFLAPLPSQSTLLASNWIAILCLAAMLFSIASAFTFIGLVKERAERKQHVAARTDSLTGIANRRAFVETAEELLVAPAGKVLLLFDLDRFKAINDRFGHEVGDAVIVAFCAVAEEILPDRAVFGRLGGEEFGCLLIGASPAEAVEAADRVRRTFAAIVLPEMADLRLSVSIGIAQATPDGDFDGLLRRADAALYVAKKSGRDRIELAGYVLRAA